ncbi:MAG TPA: GerMN domain-containing protein [Verrucomicrobiae bacterium]|nr:GerMN domain-containing protein [Verrucomicrobiae bacterium]
MMTRQMKIILICIVAAVIAGLFALRALHRRATQLQPTRATEEEERREVIAPPISTPTDVSTSAQLFWISPAQPDQLGPVTVQLPLSADPAHRAKQLITALIATPPSAAQRTLPAGATLLNFYLLPNGQAVADFSDELSTEMPSGILSEWLAVSSITQTLAANVPQITQLKILVHGRELDTLAGHIDMTDFFDVRAASVPSIPASR